MSDGGTEQQTGGLSDQELLAATPRGRKGREAQVGLFVILGLLSFIIVLFWMTDPATLRGRDMLITRVENAGGIRDGDPVQMYGVNIGRINRFEMVDEGVVDIRLEIEGEWQIPIGSTTRFGAAGIFGGRTLEIVAGSGPGVYEDGDTIPGEGAVSEGLLGAVDDMTARIEPVLEGLESLLNAETVGSVQGSATEMHTLLTELSGLATEQRESLGELSASLQAAADNVGAAAEAGPEIASAIARADTAMATLASTSETLDAAAQSLQVVLARIERGEGTLGRMSTDPALYESLNEAAVLVSEFLVDFQANPNKYINISIF